MMHALVLLCVNQYKKLEVPTFTNCKDMIWSKLKKKMGHVTLTSHHAPLRGGLSA